MKKTFSVLLFIAFVFSLSGCSSETLKNETLNDTPTTMQMSYDLFSGERSKTVTLKENTEINVEFVTSAGEIALSIVDKAGNKAYTGNAL